MINGNDLIKLGYKPTHWFKDVIVYANMNNLEGNALKAYVESIIPKPIEQILPHEKTIPYFKNITAETFDEIKNLESVVNSMDMTKWFAQ